ncbi:MAG: PfkB family carbohydrate kinase [Candidatus Hydrogenedentota bacterium]
MDVQRYRDLIARFSEARVMVVGDIYLDENVFGVVTGISLEAPIPVFEIHDRRHNPGAAGNAACNVAALGARTDMVGFIGSDPNGEIVQREFASRKVSCRGIVVDPERPTNTYGKLRAGTFNAPSQEVLRTDTPRPTWIAGETEDAIIARIRELAPENDAIVVVDQACSVATDRVLQAIVETAREHGLITVGDSRERAGAFQGFDVIVPNDREAGLGAGIEVSDEQSLEQAGRRLLNTSRNALITRGPKGVSIFREDGGITRVPCDPLEPVDVTGAGDTVTAAAAVTLVAGGTLHDAAVLGNKAAGLAVMRQGVVTVSAEELAETLEQGQGLSKARTSGQLAREAARLREQGKTIVWTNGCFDILHAGHITYLLKAAALGDVLIVGLNGDESVRRVKGPRRPVHSENHRALLLSALECVDYVCIFGEDSPLELIREIRPAIYAKGSDYTLDSIDPHERALMEELGGRIKIISGVEGESTSAIITRIAGE